jgi:hypothetical protein
LPLEQLPEVELHRLSRYVEQLNQDEIAGSEMLNARTAQVGRPVLTSSCCGEEDGFVTRDLELIASQASSTQQSY